MITFKEQLKHVIPTILEIYSNQYIYNIHVVLRQNVQGENINSHGEFKASNSKLIYFLHFSARIKFH